MAGDTRLSRLLIAAWHGVRLAALVITAACSAPPGGPHAAADRQRPSVPAATQEKAESAPVAGRPRIDVDGEAEAALDRAAWARLRLADLSTIQAHRAAEIETPIHPGSLFKIIAARAAVEQHGSGADVRTACPRRVEIDGRRADCVHPDLGRPLTLEDALAHSCNHFFVRLARTLDRRALEWTVRRLVGRPFDTGDTPLPLVVLGLEGPTMGLRVWAQGLRAAAEPDGHSEVPVALVRGLLRAATEGTASALAERSALTLAKTGTTVAGRGGEGLVVAWRPELGELVIVRAPGVAGRDAARLAAAVWARAAREREPMVRVGRTSRPDAGAAAPVRIDTVPLEAYVAGVVAGEAEESLASATREALAIAARSYAIAPDGRHAAEGYDTCDTTHCQRLVAATHWSRDAAAATRGIVLARAGTVVAVPYSAACGGTLVAPSDVWGERGAATVTRTGPDPGRHAVPNWSSEVTVDDLVRALRLAGHRGETLRGVRVVARSRVGHPTRVALDGLVPGEIDATAFRHIVGRTLGWDVLKSHVWQVSRTGRGYRFAGQGKGHGAGVCVRGADALASAGAHGVDVLRTYVPGARPVALQDRVTVRLSPAPSGNPSALAEAVRAQMADLRLRLGVTTARQLEVRVHPTVQAYQRATGRAWWTAATTSRRGAGRFRLDLAPPSSPDAVAATLRHELVHVLTMESLTWAPAWADEGLATLAGRLDGDRSAAPLPAGGCPSATQMRRPGRHAMEDTYLAAAACVATALPDGLQSWRRLAGLAAAPPEAAAPVYAQ